MASYNSTFHPSLQSVPKAAQFLGEDYLAGPVSYQSLCLSAGGRARIGTETTIPPTMMTESIPVAAAPSPFLCNPSPTFSRGGIGAGGDIAMGQLYKQLSINDAYLRRKHDEDRLILTEGFEKLSTEDRDRALAELHGVTETIEETPEFIETSLRQLEVEISRIKHRRCAYDKALFLNPRYVENRDFRLMFLRCDRYDLPKAAARLVKHFETKLELFGLERLARDITFEDLDEDSAAIYMSGSQWFTNTYDRSGRRIYLITLERSVYKTALHYLRVGWYLRMVAAEDIRTQMNGVTMIVFSAGASIRRAIDVQSILQLPKVVSSTPIRRSALHFCYEDKIAAQVYPNPITLAQLAIDVLNRVSFRIHHGSVVEMKYALMSYGIGVDSLPLDPLGHLKYDEFFQEAHARRIVEAGRKQRLSASSVVDCPTQYDVLLGRGKPYQDFPGNVRLNQIVELQRPSYDKLDRSGKSDVVMEVVHVIHKLGGRFLKRTVTTITTTSTNSSALPSQSSSEDDGMDTSHNTTTGTDVSNVDRKKAARSTTSNDDAAGGRGGGGATTTAHTTTTTTTSSSWEEVDFQTAHRKVSNCFQNRKRLKP